MLSITSPSCPSDQRPNDSPRSQLRSIVAMRSAAEDCRHDFDRLKQVPEPEVLVLLVLVVVEVDRRDEQRGEPEPLDERGDRNGSAERAELYGRAAGHARDGRD